MHWGKFSEKQRDFIADKMMDTANYALAGLTFGQALTRELQILPMLLGVLIYAWFWVLSISLKRG